VNLGRWNGFALVCEILLPCGKEQIPDYFLKQSFAPPNDAYCPSDTVTPEIVPVADEPRDESSSSGKRS
jgi:hypothetical protein